MDAETLRLKLLAVLNRTHSDTSVFHDDVLVLAHAYGGWDCLPSHYRGREEVVAFVSRPVEKLFEFDSTPFESTDPDPDLPTGTAWRAAYTVKHIEVSWQNQGEWIVHEVDGQVVGWRSVPRVLEESNELTRDDMWAVVVRNKKLIEELAAGERAPDHDHDHDHGRSHEHGHDHAHEREHGDD